MSMLTQAVCALRPTLQVRTTQGRPIVVGERQIVPIARSISLAVGRPGGPVAAGYVLNRPVAVLETWHGQTRRIPIVDLTRLVQLAFLAAGVLLALAASRKRRQRRRDRRRALDQVTYLKR